MATITVHVAYMDQVRVSPDGTPYHASNNTRTIAQSLQFTTEWRISPDSSNANTTGYPDLRGYLELEAADGFEPVSVLNTLVVTKKVT